MTTPLDSMIPRAWAAASDADVLAAIASRSANVAFLDWARRNRPELFRLAGVLSIRAVA